LTKSPLDYDFKIGLDDVEDVPRERNPADIRNRSKDSELFGQGSIFDEPVKSKKERDAENRRQRENLKRYAWLCGKAGAICLKLFGEFLVWTGEKSKIGGLKLDRFASQMRPWKRSLKKDAKALLGR
jgi:hypothetical protein